MIDKTEEIPGRLRGLMAELDALSGSTAVPEGLDGLPDLGGTDFILLSEIGRGGMGGGLCCPAAFAGPACGRQAALAALRERCHIPGSVCRRGAPLRRLIVLLTKRTPRVAPFAITSARATPPTVATTLWTATHVTLATAPTVMFHWTAAIHAGHALSPHAAHITAYAGPRITSHLRTRHIELQVACEHELAERFVAACRHQLVPGGRQDDLNCGGAAARQTLLLVAGSISRHQEDTLARLHGGHCLHRLESRPVEPRWRNRALRPFHPCGSP